MVGIDEGYVAASALLVAVLMYVGELLFSEFRCGASR
jgi:hypothetical protein